MVLRIDCVLFIPNAVASCSICLDYIYIFYDRVIFFYLHTKPNKINKKVIYFHEIFIIHKDTLLLEVFILPSFACMKS